MKLYDIPRNTLVRVIETGEEVMFHHIDGMYSYCTYKGQVCHLAAWEEVEIVNTKVVYSHENFNAWKNEQDDAQAAFFERGE